MSDKYSGRASSKHGLQAGEHEAMSDLIELLRQSNDEIDHAAADEIECLTAALQKIRTEPGDARDCRYIAGQALAATEQEGE